MNLMEEQWRKTSLKYFGGFLGEKRDHFHFDILCVLLGIKSAHLVDYFPPAAAAQPHKLQLFLQEILLLCRSYDCSWTDQNLCIILLEEDVLFVNFTSLVAYRNALPSPVFVDVTSGKEAPVLMEKQNHMEELILSTFDVMERHFSAHSDGSIPIIRHCCHGDHSADGVTDNLCSLFGQLLGYPVVYWFDTSKGYNLDMERLVRHSVMARRDRVNGIGHSREQDYSHPLFSFTVPECVLTAEVRAAIHTWYSTVRRRAADRGGGEVLLQMKTETIQLPTVAL